MSKTLLCFAICSLCLLLLGTTYAPDNAAFWLASGQAFYQHIREVLLGVLLVQAVTRPPRHAWFRWLTGTISGIVFLWACHNVYANEMPVLDALGFLIAAISIGLTTLEKRFEIPVHRSNSTVIYRAT